MSPLSWSYPEWGLGHNSDITVFTDLSLSPNFWDVSPSSPKISHQQRPGQLFAALICSVQCIWGGYIASGLTRRWQKAMNPHRQQILCGVPHFCRPSGTLSIGLTFFSSLCSPKVTLSVVEAQSSFTELLHLYNFLVLHWSIMWNGRWKVLHVYLPVVTQNKAELALVPFLPPPVWIISCLSFS